MSTLSLLSHQTSEGTRNLRVHQWLRQQQQYTGVAPPDDEHTGRQHGSSDAIMTSSLSEVDVYTDYTPAEEGVKFSGVNRFYSPNMARRRGYVLEPSIQCESDIIALSTGVTSFEGAMTPPPLSKYLCGLGGIEGNTFPRRSKVCTGGRSLFKSPLLQCQHEEKAGKTGEQSKAPAYTPLLQQVTEKCPRLEITGGPAKGGQAKALSRPLSPEDGESNKLLTSMSLDTQRLFSGNLPDVALTAAKAIHKRELSDSMPKYNFWAEKDNPSKHFRGSSPTEPDPVVNGGAVDASLIIDSKNDCVDGQGINGDQSCKIVDDLHTRTKSKKKVQTFAWPKRAVLPMHKDIIEQGCDSKTDIRARPESGYNTEKSEEKIDAVFFDENDSQQLNVTTDSVAVQGDTDIITSPLSSTGHFSLTRESVHSEGSEEGPPPARPPPPSQKSLRLKDARAQARITTDVAGDTNMVVQPSALVINDPMSRVQTKSKHDQRLPSVGNVSGKSGERSFRSNKQSSKTKDTPIRLKSSFCASSGDLTRHVSMSLKDLIRIHEQEIARVSGLTSLMNGLKNVETIKEGDGSGGPDGNRRGEKGSWKRHTTIGLVAHDPSAPFYTELHDAPFNHPHDLANTEGNDETTNLQGQNPVITVDSPRLLGFLKSREITEKGEDSKQINTKEPPPVSPKPWKSSLSPLSVERSQPIQSSAEAEAEDVNQVLTRPINEHKNDSYNNFTCKNVSVQTDIVGAECEYLGISERDKLESVFNKEREEMQQKLEEQKKVSKAYQKLEDRYRRKVYELQKALHACTCSRVGNMSAPSGIPSPSYQRPYNSDSIYESTTKHDVSVQKVDGILHQLETWLTKQSPGQSADDASALSTLTNNENTTSITTGVNAIRNFSRLSLDVIDQIDATSV